MEATALKDLDMDQEAYSAEDQSIGNLVEQTRTFAAADPGLAVHRFFTEHPSAEGVVIVENHAPAGLIMRNDFYQKIGTLYGRDLFMSRPIKLIMNTQPLVVDVSVDIATIGLIAMNRPHDQLYDLVVITENEKFSGVVSVKRFMIELSQNREVEIKLLKRQKEILHEANETEIRNRRQIEEKSLELREKNESIKNLMDNAGQGFLSFGQDLAVSGEYSLECVQIFRVPMEGRNFLELMAKHVSPETIQTMARVFESIFASGKSLREKVYLSLLPPEFGIYGKTVSVAYKIIPHGDHKKMMLILTDVTEKRKLEARMTEERNNVKMVAKALTKQSDVNLALEEFYRFVPGEARAMAQEIAEPRAALAEIFRLMHTYKGDFAQLGLHNTAANLHVIEDELAALVARPEAPDQESLAGIVAGWDGRAIARDDVNILADILGKSFFEKDERFQVSAEMVQAVEAQVAGLPDGPERRGILLALRRLRLCPLKSLVAEYQDYLQALAARLGKSVEPLRVSGDDVFVEKELVQKFVKSLVHVIRNMIDHGIETPEDRLENGKREQGRIACVIEQSGDTVCLRVSDDGQGIDAARVLQLAVAKGLVSPAKARDMAPQEVYGLLFADSFSTKEEVSALSGRGVGLSAVKAEVERLGGTIRVSSTPGQGSTFDFLFPLAE
ncbi:Signal transduction histidine kinase CheA [Desulfovibrio sp. DV]|uniref:ATP-binding protein n=1 Tax=Desulfovibrio sp. DV TaxID=1844708 RepID=UPI00094BC527|nr:ATP-binding protein [Desulfovibrio sp. DV]OLN30530.1 Signal transduction histidine kinase CheA [Desulfovibrio sp. DV]